MPTAFILYRRCFFMQTASNKTTAERKTCVAIVPAAGSSNRMKDLGDKLFLEIDNIPIIALTLSVLENAPEIDAIIVSTRKDMIEAIERICQKFSISKFKKAVVGGSNRTESVLNGIIAAENSYDLIAIHDAARPFISQKIIKETVAAASIHKAAAPAIPMKDTIKKAEKSFIIETIPRETLIAIQTPQIFERDIITASLKKAVTEKIPITDDCSAVEAAGMRIFLTEGDYFNIKITTPEDLIFAKAIMAHKNYNEVSIK